MKKNLTLSTIAASLFVLTCIDVHAARLYMNAPITASSNRAPVVVQIFLDTEKDTVSGIAGTFSFPSDLFALQMISTQNGIVSLWAIQPHISAQRNFDGRTRITFEGAMPGGFSGVRSPYYIGEHPGLVFTVALIPLYAGEAEFLLDGTEIHAFDANASNLSSEDSTSHITIPTLSGSMVANQTSLTPVVSNTFTVSVERSPLIDNNAWYLSAHEDEVVHSIDHIEIAETNEYDGEHVSEYQWHTVSNPYVLLYQSRNKYIHTKIIYTNHTYAIKTIAPVENSSTIFSSSRILIYILLISALLVRYAKTFSQTLLRFFKKRT
jgi:hypothetical protein